MLPIYEDHGQTYQADTCQALAEGSRSGQVRLEALARGHYPGRKLSRGTLSGVKTVGYWDAQHDQDWGLDWHRNEGIELTLLETGSLGYAIERQNLGLFPDDLTITRPWQRHKVGSPNVSAGRLHWLILDVGVRRPDQPWRWPSWVILAKNDREELTNMLRHNEQPVWHATKEIRRCFQVIAQAVENDDQGSQASRLTVQLNALFLHVLEMLRCQEVPLDHTLSGTRRTVDLFLADLRENPSLLAKDWTIGEMASSCGLGVTQFVHHTRQLTNMTPRRYLNHHRLETAGKLLTRRPELSVTQVAIRCGFSSSQYFATAFHRHFGSSPRTYRA